MLLEKFLETAGNRSRHLAASDPKVRWTYRQLLWAAATLKDLVDGNSRAENVGLMLPCCSAFAASFFGTLWAGRVPVPLNFLLAEPELKKIAADARLDLVITVSALAEQARWCGCRIICLDRLSLKGRALWRRLKGLPRPPHQAPDDIAVLMYTSGTWGQPKGVCLTHRNLLANSRACLEHARIDVDQRFLGILPVFHSFGLTTTVVLPLTLGASVHYMPRFQPLQVLKALAENGISIVVAVPSMYAALARLKEAEPRHFATVTLAISGGEPLGQNLYETCRDKLGLTIYEGYGLTETAPVVSINVPHAHRPGTVGRPIPQVEVRIVNDQGQPLRPEKVGQILVRGPNIMKGYHNRPDLTRQIIDESGWLWTGDMGSLDTDGFLRITGRKREMIIVSGENLFPSEIERVLESHPAVAEAAVIGLPDETRGEVPIAFVIPTEGRSPSSIDLREFCRQHLAGYKVPPEIRFVNDLPRSPTGKVLKRKLLEAVRSASPAAGTVSA